MSLINEALRRARQTHPTGVSQAATPTLRPVESARPAHGSLFTLPFLGAVVLLVAGIILWGWSQTGKTTDLKIRANSRSQGGDTVSVPEPQVTPPLQKPVTVAAATTATAPSILSTNVTAPTAEPDVNNTNLVEAPKPEPVGYKLQGIFYKRNNPSAAINGKTVFVGGHVGDARVTAISVESVTIVTSAGETKTLEIGD